MWDLASKFRFSIFDRPLPGDNTALLLCRNSFISRSASTRSCVLSKPTNPRRLGCTTFSNYLYSSTILFKMQTIYRYGPMFSGRPLSQVRVRASERRCHLTAWSNYPKRLQISYFYPWSLGLCMYCCCRKGLAKAHKLNLLAGKVVWKAGPADKAGNRAADNRACRQSDAGEDLIT